MECSLQHDACESAFPSPFPPPVALITMNLHRRFMQNSNPSQLRMSSCFCATSNTGTVLDALLVNWSCM